MGRRELGDYSGKFNRKREYSIFDASTGVAAFLCLKKGRVFGDSSIRSVGRLSWMERHRRFAAIFQALRLRMVYCYSEPASGVRLGGNRTGS
jgi:hypothetical protein